MRLSAQGIYPGVLENAYRRELQSLIASNALPRLWAKDPSLWPAEEHEEESVKKNLSWLDLPEKLGPLLHRVVSRASEIESAGFEDVVLVTLGDSSLAAEAVLQRPAAKLGKRTFLLDNIDPDSVRALEADLHLEKTLFIFASKRGKDLDAHALLLYFLDRLRLLEIPSPQRHFVALAEENSYLEQLAIEYQFIEHFPDPPGIHGRYSSLIHFNFFLAAVAHLSPDDLLARVQSMAEACGPKVFSEANPALSLGAFLAAAEAEHSLRLIFLTAETLRPVAERIGSLVGASTCKQGRGLIPLFGGTSYPLAMQGNRCVVASLKMGGEDQPELQDQIGELRKAGAPVLTVELAGPVDLGAELFKWELATTLACSRLGVNPFPDPDMHESRARSTELLEQVDSKHALPAPTVRVRDTGIELYAEGNTRRELSTLNMTEALRSFFELRRPDGYLALLPFTDVHRARSAVFRRTVGQLEKSLEIPILLTPGSRYLYSLGQVYHGGPAKGLFVTITADPVKDLSVPGATYTFGQLQLALAQGDFEALSRQGRPVIRLHLTNGVEQGLAQMESILAKALGKGPIASS